MKHYKLAAWWISLGIEVARKTANNPAERPETRERCTRQISRLTEAMDVLARDSERRENEKGETANDAKHAG